MSAGCKIIRDFKRPDPELVRLFDGIPVANIDDCMGRIAAVNNEIYPLGKNPLLGIAFTIRVPQGDNLLLHAAMDMAKPGDVIMLDAGGFTDRAIFGELMCTYMRSRGIQGIVCDGAVRDSEALSMMENFAVYAKGVTPNGPYKNGPGEINVPVVIGDKVVFPGDIIVGDGDGVIIIRPDQARDIAFQAKEIVKKEEEIMRRIVEEGTYIRPWVQEKVEEIGFEIE